MAKIKNLPANKIEIFNLFARAVRTNLDNSDIIGQFGQTLTIRTKLDNSDKICQFEQTWTIRTKFVNSNKLGQFGQNWTN